MGRSRRPPLSHRARLPARRLHRPSAARALQPAGPRREVFGPARIGPRSTGWSACSAAGAIRTPGRAGPSPVSCARCCSSIAVRGSVIWSPAVLDGLRRRPRLEKRAHLFQLQRALVALGLMDGPDARGDQRPAVEGVSATWIAWAHRWEATSTLTPSTRRHVRLSVLKAGRWLGSSIPTIAEPAAWTRELCAAYVAAVDRMHIGDFAQRRDPSGAGADSRWPPRSKDHLGAHAPVLSRRARNGAGFPGGLIPRAPWPRRERCGPWSARARA